MIRLAIVSVALHAAIGVALWSLPARRDHHDDTIEFTVERKARGHHHDTVAPRPELPKPSRAVMPAAPGPKRFASIAAPPHVGSAAAHMPVHGGEGGQTPVDAGKMGNGGGDGSDGAPAQRPPAPPPAPHPAAAAAPTPHAHDGEEKRVGGDGDETCSDPPQKPQAIVKTQIEYTDAARAANVEGKLTLVVSVNADGEVTDVSVEASVEPSLDAAAIAQVKTWRFRPATKCGKPVAGTFRIKRRFELGD